MTSISNGESGFDVRTKLNASVAITDAFTVSSGNVGIGATPVSKLTVGSIGTAELGSTSYGSSLIRGVNYTLSASQRGILDIEMTGLATVDNGATLTFTNNSSQFVQGYSYVGAGIKVAKESGANLAQTSYLAISTNNLGTLAERMRISAAGNVGIGTSSPSLKLDVRGGSIVAGVGSMVLYGRSESGFPSVAFNTGYFALGTNNTDAANGGLSIYTMASSTLSEAMRINTSGNVGIGTTTGLTKKLNLASDATSDAATRMTNSANTLGFEVGLLAGNADAAAYIYQRANSVMFFGTNNLTRMTIDNSGNVGIGAVANTSSILDAQSTTKGVRFPNMTTTQKTAMANVAGNVVFDTTLGKLCVNSGSGWQTITSV